MKPILIAAVAANALLFTGSAATAAVTFNFTPLAGQAAILDHTDGTGTAARYYNPVGAATDSSGNVYVADSGDHTIRKIDAAGNSSIFAGASGSPGQVDGSVAAARFDYPSAVAVGPDNSVYVTDVLDGTLRRISGGAVTTILAGLNGPQGVAVDSLNNVYVSDTNNSAIKKISAAGAVTLFAGSVTNASGLADGTGTSASFNFPAGLATDAANNLYVADFDNSAVRMITPAGVVTTLAGTSGTPGHANGTGLAASFDHPTAVSADSAGDVFVVDTSNQLIRKIAATTHVVTTVSGTYDVINNRGVIGKADGTAATFFYPQGIAVNAGGTQIFVADTGNHSIRTINGGSVSTFSGNVGTAGSANGAAGSATFRSPYGVAVDGAGNVYVADAGNNLIRKLSNGTVTTLAGTANVAGSANSANPLLATFNSPSGVAVDRGNNVYVADTGNNAVRLITSGGIVSTFAVGFNGPQGVAVDAAGNVYVADTGNNVIDKITATGAVSVLAGSPGNSGSSDSSVGTGARFNRPNAVAVDAAGNVYVSDFGNSEIRKIAATTTAVTTLAGAVGQAGLADGSTSNARFNQTYGLAVDSSGNIYVTDTLNRAIRQITATGTVSTVTGIQSRFFYPEGIAVSGNNLFVVDADNNSLSEGALVSNLNTGLANHTVAVGGTATFAVLTPDGSASYQWQVSTNGGIFWNNVTNGGGYSGATTSALTITGATAGMSGNQYRAVATNSLGTSSSPAGTLYVGNARLLNLSSSGFVGTTGNDLVAGFVISGAGGKNILLRGIGPTLANFGVTGVLAQPSLTLYTGGTPPAVQAANTIWGGSPALANVMSSVFAFALPANSADSVLYMSGTTALGSGTHTAHVSSAAAGTGSALVEVYDADTGTPTARLSNISSSAPVGAVNLVAGFVIGGNTSETVLIRGVGPGLAALGVPNTLANVMLTLYDSHQTVIASNNGWSATSQAQLAATFAQVGAFSLPAGSADSAILVTLAPGSYTASVSGVGGATGTAIVEVYEVP
jgi:sugar lactone lactonase YvrE